jgi:protease I
MEGFIMDLDGKHIAILVDDYFEQPEFEDLLLVLKDVGFEVEAISIRKKEVRGLCHAEMGDKFTVDLLLDESSSDDYDALVLPRGAINVDSLRMNTGTQNGL